MMKTILLTSAIAVAAVALLMRTSAGQSVLNIYPAS